MKFRQSITTIASFSRTSASRCSTSPCHWMPWQQRLGWLTLRIMSIHHLDTLRYWFGEPLHVFASVRPDPRTAKQFAHDDGICLYILEYASGLRALGCDDVWTGPAREGA